MFGRNKHVKVEEMNITIGQQDGVLQRLKSVEKKLRELEEDVLRLDEYRVLYHGDEQLDA